MRHLDLRRISRKRKVLRIPAETDQQIVLAHLSAWELHRKLHRKRRKGSKDSWGFWDTGNILVKFHLHIATIQ